MLIDTHSHIQFHAYRDDMDEVIKRAREARVFMIAVGSQRDTSANAVKVAEANPDLIWAAVGLHPNHLQAMRFDEDELSIQTRTEDFDPAYYRELAKSPKVVAIGECGLDYYRMPDNLIEVKPRYETESRVAPAAEVRSRNPERLNLDNKLTREAVIAKQKQVFRQHLDLADELGLPVIIHVRSSLDPELRVAPAAEVWGRTNAHSDVYEILKEYVVSGRLKQRGVIHCFTAGRKEAERYIDLGFYIAFSGVITFKSKKPEHLELLEAARATPLEKIVIETDAPYLTPEPHRGKRNEPVYVKYVAEKIAELRNISYDQVETITTKNAKELFRLRN